MSIKTILVHLNDERRAEKVLGVAVAIARTQGAHLIGLDVSPAVPEMPPLGVPFAGDVMSYVTAIEKRSASKIKHIFESMTAGQAFVAEWRELKRASGDLADVVVAQGRSSDLIVVAQADPTWDLSPIFDFPERLALSAGRPAIIVPNAGRFDRMASIVLVAWNGSREATRAVFDAVPLLQAAEKVIVVNLNEPRWGKSPEPDLAIASTLSRHGVNVTALQSVVEERDIGEALLSRLAETGAELLVMGAWGHSRLHEMVFGGVTRHIMRHMTTPTLVSH